MITIVWIKFDCIPVRMKQYVLCLLCFTHKLLPSNFRSMEALLSSPTSGKKPYLIWDRWKKFFVVLGTTIDLDND